MASRGVNKVILIGNLGNEPEVRYMPSGDPVANVSIATSESWKDKNTGEMKERTEWHRVVFMGKLADVVKQYLHKGSKIYVEGQLRTSKWKDKEGVDRYTTEVHVGINGSMQMLDGRPGGGSSAHLDDAPGSGGEGAPRSAPAQAQFKGDARPPMQDFDDDIPF